MARPIKRGLDYFELDCLPDDKFRLIQAEFGLKGFALVVKLLQKIYGGFGYYCELGEEELLLFALENTGSDCEGKKLITQVIEACIKRGIFSKELFQKYQILTSKDIQERYLNATFRREKVEWEESYLLISVDKNSNSVINNLVNVSRNSKNVDQSTQSREEKSIVYRSSINTTSVDTIPKTGLVSEEDSNNIDLILIGGKKYFVTSNEITKLKAIYPNVDVIQQLRNMKGWLISNPSKRKTEKGIKRFINNWLIKEQNRLSTVMISRNNKSNKLVNFKGRSNNINALAKQRLLKKLEM